MGGLPPCHGDAPGVGAWGVNLLDLSGTSYTVERLEAMTQARHRYAQGVVSLPPCHEDAPESEGRDFPLGEGMFVESFWNFVAGERGEGGGGVDAGLGQFGPHLA